MKRTTFVRGCESAILLIGLYYLAYRYPFQIGSSSTSTDYTDTPLILKVGKYALLIAVMTIYPLAPTGRLPATRTFQCIVLGCGYLAAAGIACTILTGHFEAAESALLWIMALLLISRPDSAGVQPFIGKVKAFSILALLFVILQVALFFTIGRLPGVSLADSIFVRFGSIWDDPNGFSVALSLIIPTLWMNIRGKLMRFVALFLGLICLVATQSLTGIAAFAMSICFGTLLLLIFGGLRSLGSFMLFGNAALCVVIAGIWIASQMHEFFELKSGSIEGHLDSLVVLANSNWTAWIGWAPVDEWGEMAYVNWFVNYGVLYTAIHLMMLLVMVLSCALLCRRNREFIPILYFLVAYCVGLGNLPLDTVFPVNLLAVFFGSIAVRTHLLCERYVHDANIDFGSCDGGCACRQLT